MVSRSLLHNGYFSEENITSDMTVDSSEFPSYAVVQKPSSLKDGSLKKNGKLIAKKVTLPPDIDTGNGNRSPAINTVAPSIQQQNVPQQYEYPTYTEVRKYPQGYGSQPSPHSPIYPQQAPYVQSSPGGYGQPFPAQYPRQVYATQRKEPDYPPNYLQHPLPQSRMGYDDDYDNTVESTPMINQPINAKNLCYKSESDLPEPQPLVYPSAKRPMVFEQTSSSKMSIYDNVELFSSKNKD
ncbi:uncharacterized protein LOC121368763 [Gigantopelta aegis]|uniref:uncharacterized protein LOC121368763 n=1 Tax=Gigantopelta aegis TaxID=1735272 RepID=UPI001B8877A7|nr:uncharacterized protein LOC121368763 [Gigantopelta aegis]